MTFSPKQYFGKLTWSLADSILSIDSTNSLIISCIAFKTSFLCSWIFLLSSFDCLSSVWRNSLTKFSNQVLFCFCASINTSIIVWTRCRISYWERVGVNHICWNVSRTSLRMDSSSCIRRNKREHISGIRTKFGWNKQTSRKILTTRLRTLTPEKESWQFKYLNIQIGLFKLSVCY